ncbi:unnamed protein product [Echinostoma caproni]|uniref:SWIB domain-containing protein n=1 Tax=Echinostoma caproni TaxID=27848 RepID=A0A183AY09_9TREM|nr:unnamed protein product [Echinostoma caproni]
MSSKLSVSCNQSISSAHVTLDRIFHNGLLDVACDKLLEYHCHSSNKQTLHLDSSARAFLLDYTIDIVKNLCEPSAPQSVSDVCDRLDYSFPCKLRPPDLVIEDLRSLVERGKKKTLYLPNDKVISCIRWAVNFEAKLQSGVIAFTDIQACTTGICPPSSLTFVLISLMFIFRYPTRVA